MKPEPAEQAKAAPTGPGQTGLYVHVPFCASTCDFCAFYQVKPDAAAVQLYLDGIAVERQLTGTSPWDTIFWGGGTPGLLAPAALEQLASLAGGRVTEWSVELAPASVTPERLAVLKAAGVNRVSMGVQSFSPDWLDALGRMHTREQIYRAYDRIRAAGFENVNLDLMFALPGQTEEEWQADVREAVRLAPEHLSTYCLTFEEDTALWVKLSEGKVKLDPEREARLYERTWDHLGEAGYQQYEISNFARPGRECRHNVNTWRMHQWVGWGPSAASQWRMQRGRNVPDLKLWSERLGRGVRADEDAVLLTPSALAEDALIFGLRMNEGVDLAAWKGAVPQAPWSEWQPVIARLEEAALVERAGPRLRLTRRGRLLADSVAVELTGAAASEVIDGSEHSGRARKI